MLEPEVRRKMRAKEDKRSLKEDPNLILFPNGSGFRNLQRWNLNVLTHLYPGRSTTLVEIIWAEVTGKRLKSLKLGEKPTLN